MRSLSGPVWVDSYGGPLIVVPASALDAWGGDTEAGRVLGGTGPADDYDRACAVDAYAEAIPVGDAGAQALVLGDEPALTCYLPDLSAFVRWLGADSETELFDAARAALSDSGVVWDECGTWETDGPAVLMDSAEAGADLGVEYPGGGLPQQAHLSLPAGRWRVRARHGTADFPGVGVVHLLPES